MSEWVSVKVVFELVLKLILFGKCGVKCSLMNLLVMDVYLVKASIVL